MTNGECNCGEVAYEVQKELSDVYICHCSICRRATGSGGIVVAIVSKDKFRWTKARRMSSTGQSPAMIGTQIFAVIADLPCQERMILQIFMFQ
ncbi:GFA family protein [Microbulbifer salipaludis]|uniref:GFA family protein n=1 Tax=Microbulbifer salipaludis TaxID=187980 RepID=A0ABS3E7W5_9GAMM|nr:GFA family protein [Microbulbifer salipaludis]